MAEQTKRLLVTVLAFLALATCGAGIDDTRCSMGNTHREGPSGP